MINHTITYKKLHQHVTNLVNCEDAEFSSKGIYRANVSVLGLLRVVCRVGSDLVICRTSVFCLSVYSFSSKTFLVVCVCLCTVKAAL